MPEKSQCSTREQALAAICDRAQTDHSALRQALSLLLDVVAAAHGYIDVWADRPCSDRQIGFMLGRANMIAGFEEALFDAFDLWPDEDHDPEGESMPPRPPQCPFGSCTNTATQRWLPEAPDPCDPDTSTAEQRAARWTAQVQDAEDRGDKVVVLELHAVGYQEPGLPCCPPHKTWLEALTHSGHRGPTED